MSNGLNDYRLWIVLPCVIACFILEGAIGVEKEAKKSRDIK
jgi:hypothetical protein